MMKLSLYLLIICVFSIVSCSSLTYPFHSASSFKSSGTIVMSHRVPDNASFSNLSNSDKLASSPSLFAPLIGYFPAMSYLPADNEIWIEISRSEKKISIYKGKETLKDIKAEGNVELDAGEYYLQHKQKQPLWYASDDYFKNRKLEVPDSSARLRYRKGALGRYALYPTTNFPIHCAPIWTEEVGGLKVSLNDMVDIYSMIPVGAPIIVK